MDRWNDFFVAQAGASAALAGLLFVAVSINHARILQFPHLPTRAVEALTAFVSVLFVATVGLVPGQTLLAYGLQILAVGLMALLIQGMALAQSGGASARHGSFAVHALLNLAPPLPFAIAGAQLALGYADGAYWLATGTLLSFMAGLIGAWVLLIEINR